MQMNRDTARLVDVDLKPNDRRYMTGIFALPPKILSAIFECGKGIADYDIDPQYGEGRTPSNKSFEWQVSQTCAVFREVALATPMLWTSLLVNGSCSFSWIRRCLDRSAPRLLDILVEDDEGHWLGDAELATLISHSLRWRSLSLTCAYEDVQTRTVARMCNAPAPYLQYLSLQVTRIERIDKTVIYDFPQIFKTGTPILNFLRLGDWAIRLFRPPLGAIATLHFDTCGRQTILYTTFRGIITGSPVLEHLSVNGDIIGRDAWPGRSDVVLIPKLRSLRICGIGGEVYSGILLGFDTPLLQSLTLRDMFDEDLDELWNLNDESRYSNLTHLSFQDFDLCSSTYKRLFNSFPHITSFSNAYANFSISRTYIIPFLSDGIVVGQEPPFFPWPHLRDVEFNFENTMEEEVILLKMADSCTARGCPLALINLRVLADEVAELEEVVVNTPTMCRFVVGDGLWPPHRNFIDSGEAAMG